MKCDRIIDGLKDEDASSPSWNTMVTMSFPMCLFLSTCQKGQTKDEGKNSNLTSVVKNSCVTEMIFTSVLIDFVTTSHLNSRPFWSWAVCNCGSVPNKTLCFNEFNAFCCGLHLEPCIFYFFTLFSRLAILKYAKYTY